MAELYRINKSTLEDLADTVRTATGQTGPISFDQIEEVAKQSIIVSNGGTSGGGSGSSEYKTCTLKICFDEAFQSNCGDLYVDVGYCTLDESGNPKLVYVDGNDGEPLTSTSSFLTIENVLCGEGIVLNDVWTSDISWFDISCDNGNSTELLYDWLWVGTVGYIVVYPSAANSTITVTYTSDSWG